MKYKIMKIVPSSTAEYWQFVVDSNEYVFESEILDVIEDKLKELSVSIPISGLKVVSELVFDNDFIFDVV